MIPIQVRQEEVGGDLNFEAICIWAAFGFMLDKDTFYKNIFWNKPTNNAWHYTPGNFSFDETVDKYASIFEEVIKEQISDKKVILPLSGGLDSRTLAAALSRIGGKPFTFSYKFQDSFNETKYGFELAKIAGWEFKEYTLSHGYLWNVIDELAEINQCYAEFTHPRQMAVVKDVATHGDMFLLGHWGDVLFDDMGLEEGIGEDELVKIVVKKMLKKGGLELGKDLWQAFDLKGNFEDHINERVSQLLGNIKIDNVNSKVRAFKSMYWATRWTNVNLQIFSKYASIALPYYDERMCNFVCETNEEYLKGRKIQIEYLKRYQPAMAKVAWQNTDPLNLFNYQKYSSWYNIPGRVLRKGERLLNEKVFKKKLITRNWELQFLGEENDKKLTEYLFKDSLTSVVPENLVEKYYSAFKTENQVYNSHPVSMLLTLSFFLKRHNKLLF